MQQVITDLDKNQQQKQTNLTYSRKLQNEQEDRNNNDTWSREDDSSLKMQKDPIEDKSKNIET
jgi:hypothetical protein